MKGTLIASAKPNEHKVRVRKKTFVYSRIRKMDLSDDKCYVILMRQVVKVIVRRVKQICQSKTTENGSDLHQ